MPRVLIAGAGSAGPAAAFWLHRAGFAVTIVEQAPELRPGGQAVDLRGVAREVAARMGLDDEIRRASIHTLGFSTVDADGDTLASMRAEEGNGDGQIAEIEILRGDLATVLHDATPGTSSTSSATGSPGCTRSRTTSGRRSPAAGHGSSIW